MSNMFGRDSIYTQSRSADTAILIKYLYSVSW